MELKVERCAGIDVYQEMMVTVPRAGGRHATASEM